MISLLTKIGNVTVFKVKKREDIAAANDRIGELMGGNYSYVNVTKDEDVKANGYQDILETLEVDLEKYNLVFCTPA